MIELLRGIDGAVAGLVGAVVLVLAAYLNWRQGRRRK
jgi:multisubunit Na+/H+ antiporter MnhB subunit